MVLDQGTAVAMSAIIVTVVCGLLGIIYRALALKVHDIEQKTITKEVFKMHREHVDDRFDKQDSALADILKHVRLSILGKREDPRSRE